MTSFRCFLVDKNAAGQVVGTVVDRTNNDLPPGEVQIRVSCSSLNYKDALASQGHPGVAGELPHVPGIDAAGIVEASDDERYGVGDEVLVTGYQLGAPRWGGFSELVRVPADWVVPRPAGLTLREAMILGTAGFTAAQSLDALQTQGVHPDAGEIVVTGASGGVGTLAISLLAAAGYRCVAVTGKQDAHEELQHLGATRVIGREEVTDDSSRPMLKARWAGAIDTVGGTMLSTLLRSTHYGGCVTACGLVGGDQLPLTVYPFILRGVSLCGIASADCPMPRRLALWKKLAGPWKPPHLESIAKTVTFNDLSQALEHMLQGKSRGRMVFEPR